MEVLRGAQKVSDLRFSHFVAPLPVINDQSLITVNDNIMEPYTHDVSDEGDLDVGVYEGLFGEGEGLLHGRHDTGVHPGQVLRAVYHHTVGGALTLHRHARR